MQRFSKYILYPIKLISNCVEKCGSSDPTESGSSVPDTIYTTKIDGVVCPPNISETVAGRLMKLAHRQRIASTTITLISTKFVLSILSILVKTFQRSENYRRHLIRPTPFPVSVTLPRVRATCCCYFLCFAITQSWWARPEPRVRVKRFSQSEFSSTTAGVARTMFRLTRFRNHSHSDSAFSCVKRKFAV